ncbi:PTS sugar transporter subunit IIA [Lactiplantibacillus sp. WILCCON 0030]|uniref:PTS sugar transporter subunit IIA n=1 Tax=Lactiplantibacillus brownii TaxID=3069269 RepID=A0ABU1ADQ4_9LACO|nr:PTS sugar transporter subunit IIA [Lactiplantibacillus brownii]MDQ7938557.1 PTS sugar transporter subunit IIA [Lactiplantibacillus brownii]
MSKRDIEVLDYLKAHAYKWTSAKELAERFECTTRTIRNVVARLNNEYDGCISSGRNGYKFDKSAEPTTISISTSDERSTKLLMALIHDGSHGINLYDYADKMFVSDAVIRNDINKLQKKIENYAVRIQGNEFNYRLIGTERAKRKLILGILYGEANFQDNVRKSIQKLIEDIPLVDLQKIIKQAAQIKGLEINNYALNNIVLHFAIALQRIQQGNDIPESDNVVELPMEQAVVQEIATQLKENYNIELPNPEKQQLAILFVGNQGAVNGKHAVKIETFIQPKIKMALKAALHEAEQNYFLDLSDEDFFTKLAIHVQNLYRRFSVDHFNRSTSLLDIKTTYPLIYDISVYLAVSLNQKLGITFTEDEITFIALHLGAYLEQKNKQQLLKVYLVTDAYEDIRVSLINKLKYLYTDEIDIFSVASLLNDKVARQADLIISTIQSVHQSDKPVLLVHPFLTQADQALIRRQIGIVKQSKFMPKLINQIQKYMTKEVYVADMDLTSRQAILTYLLDLLKQKKYIPDKFGTAVDKRENMSSTGFPSGVAIPHAFRMDALKSFIAVYRCSRPIMWQNQSVKIIFLIGINRKDAQQFNDIFETLVNVLSEPINVNKLAETISYQQFLDVLKEQLQTENVGEL